jgi:hypothetical protein
MNRTGFSPETGKALFALWLYCKNNGCSKVAHGVPESKLIKSGASEEDASRWASLSNQTLT